MPYKVFAENGKYCVYKHDEAGNKVGKTHGCHPSRKNANEQLRALYAAEPGIKEVGMGDCPNCGAKAAVTKSEGDGNHPADHYLVVEDPQSPTTWHLRYKNTSGAVDHGLCGAAWAALHGGYRGNKYEGPAKQKAITKLTAIYNENKWPLPGVKGLKAFEKDGERYLVLWTSNAFQDREGEIFETKALEEYVARHDATGDYGRVWFWHVKGTDFADVVWEDIAGRMLVSVAQMDHTAYADKMWHAITHPEDYPDVLPLGWGTSHGYAYRVGDKQNGVYGFMEKFETTILPYHRASNLWGGIKEAVEMARTKEKDDALKRLVTDEVAAAVLEDAEKASSLLEQAGISFKEDSEANDNTEADEEANEADEEDVEAEAEAEEESETTAEDDEQLYELEVTDDLVKEIAGKVDVTAAVKEHVDASMTGLKEQIVAALTPVIMQAVDAALGARLEGQKEQIVQQALSGKIKLAPWSASRSNDTAVSDDKVTAAKEAKTGKRQQDVVASVVQGMLSGNI